MRFYDLFGERINFSFKLHVSYSIMRLSVFKNLTCSNFNQKKYCITFYTNDMYIYTKKL